MKQYEWDNEMEWTIGNVVKMNSVTWLYSQKGMDDAAFAR